MGGACHVTHNEVSVHEQEYGLGGIFFEEQLFEEEDDDDDNSFDGNYMSYSHNHMDAD